MDYTNKTVLITGGASGMGLLCGQTYAKDGANIVLADINAEALEKCVAEIAAYPAHVIGVPTDVRDYAQVVHARDMAVQTFGSIDILINCAGGAETRICQASGEFPDIPIDVYDFGIDVNLKGPLYFDHAVLAQMRIQKSGVIIHLGSITGEEGCAGNVAYAASKSALMTGMTKSIARYGAQYNVRCVCVAPGPVLTRPAMARMKTMVGRAAEPSEIVDLIQYLTSDRAAFITGTTYMIDGGRSAMGHA